MNGFDGQLDEDFDNFLDIDGSKDSDKDVDEDIDDNEIEKDQR